MTKDSVNPEVSFLRLRPAAFVSLYGSSDVDDEDTVAPVAAKKVDTASLTPAERALLRTITRSRTIYPGIGYGGLGLGTLGYGGIFDEDAIDRPVSSSDEAQAQSSDQTESAEGDSVTDSVQQQPQSKSIVLRLPKRLLFQLIRQFGQRVDYSTHGRSALWNRYALRGRLPWAGRRRFWAAAPSVLVRLNDE
ncbi:hypothetical protein BV898_19855 [Hypsibius exemplaris]|uniref:Uncharacterized protein n=1 Tax=Hypsibius exemplaris TaxID=2072580 RepID=A0A9X6NM86_HYPEX|nr:hypothetical protein BV898_19855 [Hypsibius exemplaris]